MTGAELLREHLTTTKLSQADFAAVAGVSTASVSLWLSGHSRPGYASALLIQSATNGAVPFACWSEGAVAEPPRGETKSKGGPAKRHARRLSRTGT